MAQLTVIVCAPRSGHHQIPRALWRQRQQNAASFKTQGILAPLLVRELEESKYEVQDNASFTFCRELRNYSKASGFWPVSQSSVPPRRYGFVESLLGWFLSGQTCPRMGCLCSRSGGGVPGSLLLLRLHSPLPNRFRQCGWFFG
jgi:hypothetical protein